MTKLRRVATALLALSLFAAACGEATDDPGLPPDAADASLDSKSDGTVSLGQAEISAVLDLVNLPMASQADADALEAMLETRVHPRPVQEIIDYRLGADGLAGGPDDGTFDTLQSLDALPYVGPVTFQGLLEVATSQGLYTASGSTGVACGVIGATDAETGFQTLTEPEQLWAIGESGCTHLDHPTVLDMDDNLPEGLKNLEAFANIEEIAGLTVGWIGLESLSGLSKVTKAGNLQFGSRQKYSLHGLENLQEVSGTLAVYEKDSLEALHSLQRVGSLDVRNVPDISALSGITSLTSLNLQSPTSLEGLHNVARVEQDLQVKFSADELNSLEGLRGLTYVGGNMTLLGVSALEDLRGLEALIEVGGNLTIDGNSLTSFAGLNGLQAVGGNLVIDNNTTSVDMTALSNLEMIGGDLVITFPYAESSLAGLGGLTAIEGSLDVSNARGITEFHELTNLRGIGGNIILGDKASRRTAQAFVDSLDYFNGAIIGGYP